MVCYSLVDVGIDVDEATMDAENGTYIGKRWFEVPSASEEAYRQQYTPGGIAHPHTHSV